MPGHLEYRTAISRKSIVIRKSPRQPGPDDLRTVSTYKTKNHMISNLYLFASIVRGRLELTISAESSEASLRYLRTFISSTVNN